VCLAAAAVLTWVLLGLVARSVPWAGVALLPYAGWLSTATALSVQYSRLN
jgi:tryptophan-rich sensory protein